jgi:hypothetical protein
MLPLIVLTMLAACQQSEAPPAARADDSRASASPIAAASAAPSEPAAATAPSGGARAVEEETELYNFDYSYPAQAGAIPALKAMLDADLAEKRSALAKEARDGRDEAKKAGFDFNKHDRSVGWQVVADLPAWLSLSAGSGGFSGGAHPYHSYDAMVWDKTANARRKASDLFVSPQALTRAIRSDFCREIDKQRAEKRGEPVVRDSTGLFDDCIDPVKSTVILGSSNKRTFDRIGVLVGPYEAGPYAEGDYEVTLPVTQAVLAAVRPEYRAAFSLKR